MDGRGLFVTWGFGSDGTRTDWELMTVDAHELQQTAKDSAAKLPGATAEHRVDPDWDLYKVGGKVFMLMTDLPGHLVVTLKADPDNAASLRERYADITPGYHMNKRHWITLQAGDTLDENLVKDLVADSYHLVVAALPHSKQPTDSANHE